MGPRWKLEVHAGEWISVCGPDYEKEIEHRVVDTKTGKVVLRFSESGDWPYMVQPSYSGTERVELAPDERHVVVYDHDGTKREVALPE